MQFTLMIEKNVSDFQLAEYLRKVAAALQDDTDVSSGTLRWLGEVVGKWEVRHAPDDLDAKAEADERDAKSGM